MNEYEVATHTISGIKLPKIFKCIECGKRCHLLQDDTSIYIDENRKVKPHKHEKPAELASESSEYAWW